jgi:hypothetical protein
MYPQYSQPQYPPVQQEPKGLAVTSMVLGICSLVIPFVGIITGVLAIVFGGVSRNHNEGGRGMAIAGIVCGIVALVGYLIWIIALAASAGS